MPKSFAAVLLSFALLAACASTPTPALEETPSDSAEVQEASDTMTSSSTPLSAESGLTTGANTEQTGSEKPYTLVDHELGFQVTCPADKTWGCTRNSDGTFKMKDMSGNTFRVRAHGAASMDNSIEAAMAIIETEYAEFGVTEGDETDNGIVMQIGPDATWATPVNRMYWIEAVKVGNNFFTCEGYTNEKVYENTVIDFEEMCSSVTGA